GPSGAACAAALLKRKRRVLLLDAGLRLEADRELEMATIRSAAKPLTYEDFASSKIPLKLAFGSDYSYRSAAEHLKHSYDGVGLRPSFALGGLSNVWGGALLPCMERDIADWPIDVERLRPHYEACTELTGVSSDYDSLTELLPLYTTSPGDLKLSRQALVMKRAFGRNRAKLRDAGIYCGSARLAVRAHLCIYCGLCLHSCQYGAIYNAGDTIAQLQADDKFTYQPGVIVTSVHEAPTFVSVRGYIRFTRKPIEVKAERVYLATGPLSTTEILLRSLGAYDQTVLMKDSQYFLLPL